MTIRVHTLGDSTLDNLYWLINKEGTNVAEAKEQSVEGQLQAKLGEDYEVISHAYDGFTTRSVLEGDSIGSVLRNSTEKTVYLREKGQGGIKPLECLQDAVEKHKEATHYVVISVGGNDFRVNLQSIFIHAVRLNFRAAIGSAIAFFKEIPQIQQRYFEILDQVQALPSRNVRPILMLQYRPDIHNDQYLIYTFLGAVGGLAIAIQGIALTALATFAFKALSGTAGKISGLTALLFTGLAYFSTKVVPLAVTRDVIWKRQSVGLTMIGALMEKHYQPILERAQRDGIPCADFSNTMNPYARVFEAQIEPNAAGGEFIATTLAALIRNYDRTPRIDPQTWKVRYPE